MNASPENNIEGAKTDITCISLKPFTNTLEKGQENGDGTKVVASGEYAIVREDVPVIDSKFVNYEVDSEGKRKLSTGEVMRANITKERRELQKAIMAEQLKERKQKESEQMEI